MKKLLKIMAAHKKIFIACLLMLVVAGATLYVSSSLGKPAEGVIVESAASTQDEAKEPKKITGKYITFNYPERYADVTNNSMSASLEHWTIVSRQQGRIGQSSQIGISVANLPAGGVKEDSAYKQFAAFTDRYTLSQANFKGDDVIIAERKDASYSRTILWPHGKYLLTITMNGGKSALTESELELITNSVTWL